MTLVCFAVREEASPFQRLAGRLGDVRILLTGIGPRNAEYSVRQALAGSTPSLVLSCGLAGGLRTDLKTGQVLFSAEPDSPLVPTLLNAGAAAGTFHSVGRVLTRAEDKRLLHAETGADAVEMESAVICRLCRLQKIPAAVIRVILDTAGEDLPLDFNRLMTPDQRLDPRKLARTLIKAPGKVPALLRLRTQTSRAATRLAQVLMQVLDGARGGL